MMAPVDSPQLIQESVSTEPTPQDAKGSIVLLSSALFTYVSTGKRIIKIEAENARPKLKSFLKNFRAKAGTRMMTSSSAKIFTNRITI